MHTSYFLQTINRLSVNTKLRFSLFQASSERGDGVPDPEQREKKLKKYNRRLGEYVKITSLCSSRTSNLFVFWFKQRRTHYHPVGVVRKAPGRPGNGLPYHRDHFTECQAFLLPRILFVFVRGQYRIFDLHVRNFGQGKSSIFHY